MLGAGNRSVFFTCTVAEIIADNRHELSVNLLYQVCRKRDSQHAVIGIVSTINGTVYSVRVSDQDKMGPQQPILAHHGAFLNVTFLKQAPGNMNCGAWSWYADTIHVMSGVSRLICGAKGVDCAV